jgi:hypothetical protein
VPSKSEHLTRADNNLRFAESFDPESTPYPDWVVAVYFYAALHLVDALLDQEDGIHPPNHEVRKQFVKDKPYLRGIKNEYRSLKDHSEAARYNLTPMTSFKIRETIIPLYQAIESHLKPQLEKPASDWTHPLLIKKEVK